MRDLQWWIAVMGLESVVFMAEERFGIHIPDAHAERMRTVGDLYMYLLGRVQRLGERSCPSAAVFYQLRMAFVNTLKVDRECVRPNTRLDALLAGTPPHRAWLQVQRQLEYTLPSLDHPWWSLVVWIGTTAGIVVLLFLSGFSWVNLCVLPLLGLVASVLLMRLAHARARLPASCTTVRDLVHEIAGTPMQGEREPAAVWAATQAMIADQTGVPRDSVKRESRFHEDLGMG